MNIQARRLALVILGGGILMSATEPAEQPNSTSPSASAFGQLPKGYLPREVLPDSLALLPPPPAAGSAAIQRDEEARQAAITLRDSPRQRLATSDAVIGFPAIPDDFSCAVGFRIDKDSTPHLYGLMARMLVDVALSTYRAKDHYKRVRPFVVHNAATCYPKDEAVLRTDGSYPSGHSAIGWGNALVLAELVPARADQILPRGRDYGQSRVICDAHWQSDVDAGRVVAAAAVARLHGDDQFRADLDAARTEVAGALQSGSKPSVDCVAEASALATQR